MKIINPSYEIITPIDGGEILKTIERVARTCYKSENLITDSSAQKMVAALVKSGHTAMIEFADIIVRFQCDIGFYKDLTRHRMASFAIESTRWCNYGGDKFGNELKIIRPVNIKEGTPEYEIWKRAMEDIETAYLEMSKLGCAADQLRMLLPHSTAAEVNVKANLREWRHIFSLRAIGHAHPSIKQLLRPLCREFASKIPVVFDDLAKQIEEEDAKA
ncbi:MAG: FAD-dependent thymidylate synthase [Rickettsiales bacterium]|jgi:thymidylate synthase (FAD)|nr:FAD-dependent thymidylate synthase [Rickettsiales bacterium]